MPKRRRNAARDYPRTARLNELLREVLAEQLDGIDDDRIGLVSISGVEVDNELTKARVYLSTFGGDPEAIVAVFDEHRGRFRKAIGAEARLRRVPDLEFIADPAIDAGGRVEEILARLVAEGGLGSDDADDAPVDDSPLSEDDSDPGTGPDARAE